jgi:dihydroxyacetone kinase DhaKLM complex PTS-EIIA-like component DhaM
MKFEKKEAEEGKEKKEKKEKVEKGETPDLLKSFTEALDIKMQNITKANTDLLNAFEDVKSENTELKKAIELMGGQRTGFKSVTKSNFIEKANQNGFEPENGKTILSVSIHKGLVENALGDAMEKAENPEIKKAIGDTLIGFNAGGAKISNEMASYLYKNHNIKLVG